MKKLIINADDFCLSPVYNLAILELLKARNATSTSVMINRYTEQQRSDVDELIGIPDISIGLHIEFSGERDFLEELEERFDKFTEVFGQEPSHLDLHRSDFLEKGYPVLMKFCIQKGLSYRNHGFPSGSASLTTTHEAISGTSESLDSIIRSILTFKEGDSGEVLFHPGHYDAHSISSLNYEREVDVLKARLFATFCRENNIDLVSYKNLIM